MISVVIKGPSFQEAYLQINKALSLSDLVELRLDYFLWTRKESLVETVKTLRSEFSIPMIFTLRSTAHGGNFSQKEALRLETLFILASLKPEYLDIESHVPPQFIQELLLKYPEIKLILSHHDLEKTPEDLKGLYEKMQKTPAFFYKIAVTAHSSLDTLRLISFAKHSDEKLITISLGPYGQISRILGPIVGCPITYAALEDNQSAFGQLSAETLIERYHYHSLNSHTALYGLIGDPIDLSISDRTHNHLFRACSLNAVYLKMPVSPRELPLFLELAKEIPFQGLSVTMPLKEHILAFLDSVDREAHLMGSVNTLLFKEGKILGFNTDGKGALNALEKEAQVSGKHIVILGAGGAAKAVAYEASKRGGSVTIVHRDKKKATDLAERLSHKCRGQDSFPSGYDIMINCTPISPTMSSNDPLPQSLVMDIITKPKETALLIQARERGCTIIYGYQMFIEQALEQFHLWFNLDSAVQDAKAMQNFESESCVDLTSSTAESRFNKRIDILSIRELFEKKVIDCVSCKQC